MLAKIIFELTVLVGIVTDLLALFSNKIHKQIFKSMKETKELEELLSPRAIMIFYNILSAIIYLVMLFYYEHFVGFRLAFGVVLLGIVGSLIDNATLFASDDHPIITKTGFKVLTRILSLVECFMLVVMGYVGWVR